MKKLKCLLFPQNCKSGLEFNWMTKHACPYCIAHPIEPLCNKEYIEKYPARHVVQIGYQRFYLCDRHFAELREQFTNFSMEQEACK